MFLIRILRTSKLCSCQRLAFIVYQKDAVPRRIIFLKKVVEHVLERFLAQVDTPERAAVPYPPVYHLQPRRHQEAEVVILEYSPLAQRLHVPQAEGLERRGLLECPPHYLAHPVDIYLAQRAVGVENLVGGRRHPGDFLRYPELP